jgi:hypothetical protein
MIRSLPAVDGNGYRTMLPSEPLLGEQKSVARPGELLGWIFLWNRQVPMPIVVQIIQIDLRQADYAYIIKIRCTLFHSPTLYRRSHASAQSTNLRGSPAGVIFLIYRLAARVLCF